jgi:hypothetical protein
LGAIDSRGHDGECDRQRLDDCSERDGDFVVPVTATTGQDFNGDSVNNDRPLYRGRNDTPGYGFKEVNLRISRTFRLPMERFRLEIIGEAENLLNSTNAGCSAGGCSGAVVTQYNAPNFKQITYAFHSRQVQVGARIRFWLVRFF